MTKRRLNVPPYSPDLNPIELAFSEFKRLRTPELIGNQSDTIRDMWQNDGGRIMKQLSFCPHHSAIPPCHVIFRPTRVCPEKVV